MRLQEIVNKSESGIEEVGSKGITVFFKSFLYRLAGNWSWDMAADAIFCSDVMATLPGDFTGTKAIFHPDDTGKIGEALEAQEQIAFLEFRIITTYGETRTVTGQNILVERDDQGSKALEQNLIEPQMDQLRLKREAGHLQTLQQVYEQCNQLTASGIWYHNAATGQTWFDDAVFLLHGLSPQSLNPHLHIFHPFLHPDDKDLVIDYTDKAFLERTPLHFEYRIVVNGKEKWIRYASKWFFNDKGEQIFSGVLQDITAYRAVETETDDWKNLAQFQKQQLLYDEKQVNIGHWQVDLLTRKVTYSDQFYRIFGIKPQSLSAHINAFLQYIHPDDQETVEALNKKMIHEHAVPETEFRIQRSDGKLRHVRQTGRLLMIEGSMIITGILEDVTVLQMLKKKVDDLSQQKAALALQLGQSDENGKVGSWVMDITKGKIEWSTGIHSLLGYKTATLQITPRSFWSFIHPQDVKEFKDHWDLAVHQKQQSEFNFRIQQRGRLHYMKATFRIHTNNETELFIGTVQDLTAEQSLQERLVQRIQLSESLTENILDRVLITDDSNVIIFWNRACEKAYGLKHEQAIGQNFFDVFPHLKTETEMTLFLNALRGEKIVEEGKHSQTGNGYYNLYLMPLWQDKKVTGVLHIIRNVTAEVELRNSLQERLRFIESLVASSVDRIVALDRNMNYLYWNKRAEDYYNIRKEDVIGKNILDVFPQLVNDPSYIELRRALKGETVHIPIDPSRKKYFETYLIPITGERGEVSSLLWIAHDLQKEWQLQQEQMKAQKKFRQEHRRMLDAQVIGKIGSFEWKTGEEKVLWSDEMYRINGMEPQSREVTVELTHHLVHPDDLQTVLDAKKTSLTTPGFYELTHRILLSDGTVKWVIQRFESLAGEDGNIASVHGTLQDITEQKKKEEELLRLKDEIAQKATDKYLMLFNSIDEGFYQCEVIFDEANNPVDILYLEENPAAVRILGMSVVGKTLKEINPNFEEHWFQIWGDVALTGISKRLERYSGPNQQWFDFHVSKVGDAASRRVVVVFQDITTRKKAEEQAAHFTCLLEKQVAERTNELVLAHKCIEAIFGAVPLQLGYYHAVRNAAGEIEDLRSVVVNDASVEKMNMTNNAEGQLISEQLPGFKDQPVWSTIKDVIETRRPQRTELYYDFGSSTVWFDVLYTPLEDGVISASLDITERKKAEEETEKNLTILRQAEDIAAIGSWEYQIPSGRFSWSDGMYRIFDYPRGAPVQPEIYLNHAIDEDRATAKRIVKNLRRTHIPFEENLRIKREDGIRWLKVKATVVNNDEGQPEKVVGVDFDITDVKEAQTKLSESQYRLEQTAMASPDSITLYDLRKKQPLYLNNCLAEWTGIPVEELVGMGIEGRLQIVHPDDRLRLLHFNEKIAAAADGKVLTLEYRIRSKDEKELWLRNRSKIFARDEAGKVTHILSILQDITEEKKAEAKLKELNASLAAKNKDLESKNEEITSFAFVASHDLKEPLRKIHTFSDWLLTKEENISETGKQSLERLMSSVKRLDTLVEDIVALTKVHVEDEKFTPVDLNLVLKKAAEEMQETIESSGTEIRAANLPTIDGIENHLVYLFKNLLSNSIKFQSPGNKPFIQIEATLDASNVTLTFTDNGIGFLPEHGKRIFQMFRRLHGRTEYNGTGMGLAICKKIMEKHNGFIEALGKLGEGAVFTCYFPLSLSTSAKDPAV